MFGKVQDQEKLSISKKDFVIDLYYQICRSAKIIAQPRKSPEFLTNEVKRGYQKFPLGK